MKISLPLNILQKKLSLVNHAISSKSPLPILQNFLLEAKNNTLQISATDLEIGIITTIPVSIEDEGITTIPARPFIELINSLPDGEIILNAHDTVCEIVSKKSKSSLQTLPHEDFPRLYGQKGELLVVFDGKTLKKDFASVIFSASNDLARPALSGILMRKEEKGFLLVATDGYRLSLKHHVQKDTNGLTLASTQKDVLIVPARVYRELSSLREESEEIKVYISEQQNQIVFEQKELILIGRVIEAEFPNFERIIPAEYSARVFFDREELLKAVKICSIFARDAANIIKLSLKKAGLEVSAQTPSLGENTVQVDGRLEGEENEIAFNARYLLDVLSHMTEDNLSFEMTGPLNPGVFKIQSEESFLHLIMPIKLQA